ncbi:MAG: hypothetical protein G3M78_03890 [Candidatus Nitrohelix vancouverensis]|uniref:Uncharacterized protein n=1 Tax=Candidatus Nitrohelix vancouverensis TaxID=2705534 RepID=A0A7T0C139_9BACT|nr:MAG: hypothetical protein G3M78_03890 [Candidatus Nitrohelix vancouverensis]
MADSFTTNFNLNKGAAGKTDWYPDWQAALDFLDTLGACHRGSTEPLVTQASMFWADTTSGKFKQRNEADDAWIDLWDLGSAPSSASQNYYVGSSEPSPTFAHLLWADTMAGKLKQRNAADDAWVELWDLGSAPASSVQTSHNALVNSNFDLWQRGTSFSATTNIKGYDANRDFGGGLNDIVVDSGDNFTGTDWGAVYEVRIDATGTPDTFKWRKNTGSWTSGVNTDTDWVTLAEGVRVKWGATTGHTINEGLLITIIGSQNKDGDYTADRFKLLSDGNDIVDLARSAETPPAGSTYGLKATVVTPNKKFGFMQLLENRDTLAFVKNGKASIGIVARVNASSGINNIRIAVIEWRGAKDAATADPVSAWGAAGANPTLNTDWYFANTPANIPITSSNQNFSVEDVTVNASTTNIGLLIWIDDTDAVASDELYLFQAQLNTGDSLTDFVPPEPQGDLLKANRYFAKTYAQDSAPGSETNAGAIPFIGNASGNSGSGVLFFPVEMFETPTIRTWSIQGYAYNSAHSNNNGIPAQFSISSPGAKGFSEIGISPQLGQYPASSISFQFSAEAEVF